VCLNGSNNGTGIRETIEIGIDAESGKTWDESGEHITRESIHLILYEFECLMPSIPQSIL